MDNRGKNFELKFRKDLQKSFPNSFILRLNDQITGYKVTSQNPCDFILFNLGKLFLLEVKTHKGASLPFSAIPQYERLLNYEEISGCFKGVILWLYEHNEVGVIYVPISTIKKMKEDGQKSFGIRHLNNENYPSYVLPTIKRKQVFLDTDYSPLMDLKEGE